MTYAHDEQKEIEADFVQSWAQAEYIFKETKAYGEIHLARVLILMHWLRERGYDRHFRAGQSLSRFVMSRSRRYGLREDQPCMMFEVGFEGNMLAVFIAPGVQLMLTATRIDVTPDIENLLALLLIYPID